ncbi:MAG: hypothetical protein KAJ98_13730 [Spirochaetaceae bacterium]|nr:hypothetical protein [Spirochaetaceae bacterium]
MNKKLTLSVDDTVILRAKRYAREHKESLSEIVENYFRIVTSDYKVENDEMAPLINELLGSVRVPDDFNFKKEKLEYLENKYFHD